MEKFVFDPPSDEEIDHSTDGDSEEEVVVRRGKKPTQSPWDFSSYTESIADEHARRSTTSIDYKISKALERRPIAAAEEADSEERSDSEIEIQDGYRSEEEEGEDAPTTSGYAGKAFFSSEDGVTFEANSFLDFPLSRPLLLACKELGYVKPTPIQAACIPYALRQRDICRSAITGSGKTAAFALPTLERLLLWRKSRPAVRALILTPTRELAIQIDSMIKTLAKHVPTIRSCVIVGGVSMKVQEAALRTLPDIVVATPGRMIDHLRNSMSVHLDELAVLILDEADRLLELGFSAEINELVKLCSKSRQTMLFSATMTEKVDELANLSLKRPVRLSADPRAKRPVALTEEVICIRRMHEGNQEAVLLSICSKSFTSRVIVFSGTKKAAHRLKILFGLAGFKAAELHGDLTQAQRMDALDLFRKQQVDFLIATDVAARGLDIVGVRTVINFACPRDITSYIHRVGRTARAGKEGHAVTFVTDEDRSLLNAIVKRVGSRMRKRTVAEKSILKWSEIIEQMEDQVSSVLREEREEMALRKAEMEVTKAENMIAHRDEIYSRPKRTWFVTEREKKLAAKALKEASDKGKGSGRNTISAEQAEELKMKEKRKREHEKNLPRKKRRKLESAREMLEDEADVKGGEKKDKEKNGISLVDVAYRRAKAVKAASKAVQAGKIVKKHVKNPTQSRTDEMQELFQDDMSEKKQKRALQGGLKKKSSFKSKSRTSGGRLRYRNLARSFEYWRDNV
ncbi:DEAD-box ATP-dependent RNA helicase 28-like [Salvia splendens]|uniref:DEAD-box ATP-dependent RNA helicase 28-like n=1 Tax=Salvia splendens TaxID=180675 RepID=UPI001C251FE5|nr:DEAD-box ATP-dependent RNA helicase 28-like [Salvia splendens]